LNKAVYHFDGGVKCLNRPEEEIVCGIGLKFDLLDKERDRCDEPIQNTESGEMGEEIVSK
jgi:hypothetical protein